MPTLFDRRQLLHRPRRDLDKGAWTDHLELPGRAEAVAKMAATLIRPSDFGLRPLREVHAPEFVDFLKSAHSDWIAAGRTGETIPVSWPSGEHHPALELGIDAMIGRYSSDLITPIGENTWESAYWSAQTALSAMALLLKHEAVTDFALTRPPGHHAGREFCGGFCYLNNAAIAAGAARSAGRRVAILDIDNHHGNGTQDIFYEDPSVLFVSIHADPTDVYPYFWGRAAEIGRAAGKGFNLNLPLPKGAEADSYLIALDQALVAVRDHRTNCLIVSFGADTFVDDPYTNFRIVESDYREIGRRIAGLKVPTLIVLEGGYALDSLGPNVAAFITQFEDARVA